MGLLQHHAVCTVHDGHGGRCGREDQCTTVVSVDAQGQELHRHDVCAQCRTRMDLPEHDVMIRGAAVFRLIDG